MIIKKVNLSKFTRFSWVLLLVAGLALVATSCKDDKDKDDDEKPPAIVLDGFYIKGGSTALTDFDKNGLLKVTRNEANNQTERAQLMEIYIAVKGGGAGFNIASVAGSVRTTYGPGADFSAIPVPERDADEPRLDFWRGSYTEITTAEGGNAFTVTTDGLYHVVIDTEIKKIVIARVEWGIIGAATPAGWNGSTQFTQPDFNLEAMTFEINDLILTKADYKFRYSNGWKVILDPEFDLGDGEKGIKANTNFGGSPTALVPGGDNISNAVPGKYTVKMIWKLGADYTASVVKTADLNITNYIDTELGLIGDGLIVDGAQHNWEDGSTIMLSLPTVENETTYIWNFNNVEVTPLGGFKIREGQDWSKKSIGFKDVNMAGLSADKFETNNDGNFIPLENGTYDIVLKIDAATEIYTFTVNPSALPTELYMLGNGCDAGWDFDNPMPMAGTGGLYTITAELKGTGTGIKFIITPGQSISQYGTNATGTSTAGPLIQRTTIGQKEPAPIPSPETIGNYIISVNTNDLTYTIAPAK